MTTAAANERACARLVDTWARLGVRHAVISPGSRSAPLARALRRDPRIELHVVLDERSAAFRALGIAEATRLPVVTLCTSGSAATHAYGAVVEAFHSGVPMIVCTADRPPELHGVGAPQTIDQQELYGRATRWFFDPGPPDSAPPGVFASVAARAFSMAIGPPAGPIQLNLPFREPLIGAEVVELDEADGTDALTPLAAHRAIAPAPGADTIADLATRVRAAAKGLVVVGSGARISHGALARFVATTGWPVLVDTITNLRAGPDSIAHYEALLRIPQFAAELRPDLAIRLGAPLTSKTAGVWLDASIDQVLVDPDGTWRDPYRSAAWHVQCDAEALLEAVARELVDHVVDTSYRDTWLAADAAAASVVAAYLDTAGPASEPAALRHLAAGLDDDTRFLVASSMPVRDLEWFAPVRAGGPIFHAHRGVNGIDGLVSSALGIAIGAGAPTVAVLGDLAFLHDAGGLLGAPQLGVSCVFVVLDNGGGGIFEFLAPAEICEPEEFRDLFLTPAGISPARVAAGYGVEHVRVERAEDLLPAVRAALGAGGVHLVHVPLDRAANVALHRSLWAAIAAAVTVAS
jgi:2-succinyl-5-enolpyruvyl-6-hydroxy-3-cyclohexene-1-carboxylate synthase